MSSGDSLASGAIHWTSRNSSTPRSLPVSTRLSAKCSAEARMTRAAPANSPATQVRRGPRGWLPSQCETPESVGCVGGIRASRQA